MALRRLDRCGPAVMQTGGYFGLVKHTEQVRYVPREALAKTPFWIAWEGWGQVATRKFIF